MHDELESEVTRVKSKSDRPKEKRDPSLTGGERGETPEESHTREQDKPQPKEPPIIQKDVT